MSYKERVVEGFLEAERSVTTHTRACSMILNLFPNKEKDDIESIISTYKSCVDQVLLVWKTEATIERVLNFIVLTASSANSPFLFPLMEHLLDRVDSKDKAARLRSCQILGKLLVELPNDVSIPDAVWDDLTMKMLARSRDKQVVIRCAALRALGRLQDESKPESCPVVEAIRWSSVYDQSKDVRATAIQILYLNASTLMLILNRFHDAAASVRVSSLLRLRGNVSLDMIPLSWRHDIISLGLLDDSARVRHETKLLIAYWLECCDWDILTLLESLELVAPFSYPSDMSDDFTNLYPNSAAQRVERAAELCLLSLFYFAEEPRPSGDTYTSFMKKSKSVAKENEDSSSIKPSGGSPPLLHDGLLRSLTAFMPDFGLLSPEGALLVRMRILWLSKRAGLPRAQSDRRTAYCSLPQRVREEVCDAFMPPPPAFLALLSDLLSHARCLILDKADSLHTSLEAHHFQLDPLPVSLVLQGESQSVNPHYLAPRELETRALALQAGVLPPAYLAANRVFPSRIDPEALLALRQLLLLGDVVDLGDESARSKAQFILLQALPQPHLPNWLVLLLFRLLQTVIAGGLNRRTVNIPAKYLLNTSRSNTYLKSGEIDEIDEESLESDIDLVSSSVRTVVTEQQELAFLTTALVLSLVSAASVSSNSEELGLVVAGTTSENSQKKDSKKNGTGAREQLLQQREALRGASETLLAHIKSGKENGSSEEEIQMLSHHLSVASTAISEIEAKLEALPAAGSGEADDLTATSMQMNIDNDEDGEDENERARNATTRLLFSAFTNAQADFYASVSQNSSSNTLNNSRNDSLTTYGSLATNDSVSDLSPPTVSSEFVVLEGPELSGYLWLRALSLIEAVLRGSIPGSAQDSADSADSATLPVDRNVRLQLSHAVLRQAAQRFFGPAHMRLGESVDMSKFQLEEASMERYEILRSQFFWRVLLVPSLFNEFPVVRAAGIRSISSYIALASVDVTAESSQSVALQLAEEVCPLLFSVVLAPGRHSPFHTDSAPGELSAVEEGENEENGEELTTLDREDRFHLRCAALNSLTDIGLMLGYDSLSARLPKAFFDDQMLVQLNVVGNKGKEISPIVNSNSSLVEISLLQLLYAVLSPSLTLPLYAASVSGNKLAMEAIFVTSSFSTNEKNLHKERMKRVAEFMDIPLQWLHSDRLHALSAPVRLLHALQLAAARSLCRLLFLQPAHLISPNPIAASTDGSVFDVTIPPLLPLLPSGSSRSGEDGARVFDISQFYAILEGLAEFFGGLLWSRAFQSAVGTPSESMYVYSMAKGQSLIQEFFFSISTFSNTHRSLTSVALATARCRLQAQAQLLQLGKFPKSMRAHVSAVSLDMNSLSRSSDDDVLIMTESPGSNSLNSLFSAISSRGKAPRQSSASVRRESLTKSAKKGKSKNRTVESETTASADDSEDAAGSFALSGTDVHSRMSLYLTASVVDDSSLSASDPNADKNSTNNNTKEEDEEFESQTNVLTAWLLQLLQTELSISFAVNKDFIDLQTSIFNLNPDVLSRSFSSLTSDSNEPGPVKTASLSHSLALLHYSLSRNGDKEARIGVALRFFAALADCLVLACNSGEIMSSNSTSVTSDAEFVTKAPQISFANAYLAILKKMQSPNDESLLSSVIKNILSEGAKKEKRSTMKDTEISENNDTNVVPSSKVEETPFILVDSEALVQKARAVISYACNCATEALIEVEKSTIMLQKSLTKLQVEWNAYDNISPEVFSNDSDEESEESDDEEAEDRRRDSKRKGNSKDLKEDTDFPVSSLKNFSNIHTFLNNNLSYSNDPVLKSVSKAVIGISSSTSVSTRNSRRN